MNTPKTKPPLRYQPKVSDMLPPGWTYTNGINNAEIAADVCRIITDWPHIEDHFIPLFAQLTDIRDINSARIVFRTIRAQDARLKIMIAALEKSPHHVDKTRKFDELIAQFKSLNGMRNDYAHGIWWTQDSSGKVYLVSELDTYHSHGAPRLIKQSETRDILDRMRKLLRDLLRNQIEWAQALSSKQPKERP